MANIDERSSQTLNHFYLCSDFCFVLQNKYVIFVVAVVAYFRCFFSFICYYSFRVHVGLYRSILCFSAFVNVVRWHETLADQ